MELGASYPQPPHRQQRLLGVAPALALRLRLWRLGAEEGAVLQAGGLAGHLMLHTGFEGAPLRELCHPRHGMAPKSTEPSHAATRCHSGLFLRTPRGRP